MIPMLVDVIIYVSLHATFCLLPSHVMFGARLDFSEAFLIVRVVRNCFSNRVYSS